MKKILAVMMPLCRDASRLSEVPPPMPFEMEASARAFLQLAFRCPWPHRN